MRLIMTKHKLVVMLCFAAVLTLTAFCINFSGKQTVTAFNLEPQPILVIDAGHGGIDGGAIGADGTRESDINLAIALKLEAVCAFFGADSIMTRIDDSRSSNAASYSEHEELVYRTELANTLENAVLLSIHQNCYPTAQPSGPQVLFAQGEASARFGQITHANLITHLAPECRRVAEQDRNNIYILKNAVCPAILVECGFVSNHSDITKLTDSGYQTKLSAVLFASYVQYLTDEIKL